MHAPILTNRSSRAGAVAAVVLAFAGCLAAPIDDTRQAPEGIVAAPIPRAPRKGILWENNDGSVGRWHYVGPSTAMNTFNWGGAGWNLLAQGKFFGDGQQSLLWQQNQGADFAFWRMNGDVAIAAGAPFAHKPGWVVVGVRDLDNDGTDDIVWLDFPTASLYTTLIVNGTIKQESLLHAFSPSPHRTVMTVGALDGSNPFVVLRDTANGDVITVLVGAGGTVAFDTRVAGNAPLEWRIIAAADFDGDGKDDLLWHNDRDGSAVVWLMDGYVKRSGARVGQAGLDWQLLDGGDYDGDGHADLLWRNGHGGDVGVWFVNGDLSVREYRTLGNAPCDWRIIGLNLDYDIQYCPSAPPSPPQVGQACSAGVPCASGLTCLRGTCRNPAYCGHDGEPCCSGARACPGNGSTADNDTLQCNNGLCEACGDGGLKCCSLNKAYCPGRGSNVDQYTCVSNKCVAKSAGPAQLIVTDWTAPGYARAGTTVEIDWDICNFGGSPSAPTMTYASVLDVHQVVQYRASPVPIGSLDRYPSACARGALLVPPSLPAGSYGVSVQVNGVPFSYGFTLD